MVSMILPQVHLAESGGGAVVRDSRSQLTQRSLCVIRNLSELSKSLAYPLRDYVSVGADYILDPSLSNAIEYRTHCHLVCELHP